jgi:hypothetical protein
VLISITNFRNEFRKSKKDTLKVILLLLLGSFFVNAIGGQLSRFLYYFAVFILFFNSKNNVLWVAFFLIITTHAFGLFFYRWNEWAISLTPTVGISFKSIIPIIFFLKFNIIKKSQIIIKSDFFRSTYLLFGLYVVFLIIWGVITGITIYQVVFLLKNITPFLLFFSLPSLFNYSDLLRLNRVVFIISIILTLFSLVDLATMGKLTNYLFFGVKTATAGSFREELTRITGGVYLSLYTIVMSFYYIITKKDCFNTWFLWIA